MSKLQFHHIGDCTFAFSYMFPYILIRKGESEHPFMEISVNDECDLCFSLENRGSSTELSSEEMFEILHKAYDYYQVLMEEKEAYTL